MKNRSVKKRSYSPSVNKYLRTPHSKSLSITKKCSFEPLTISIDNQCYLYDSEIAISYLLEKLRRNKHVNVKKIILPKQYSSNCWFNTMFVLLFISDKGRKFFSFFRALMILGELPNGDSIPSKLREGFAFLNYNIDACLSGNQYALHSMNTNKTIEFLYSHIKHPHIFKKGEAGNPFKYYNALVNYLSLRSLSLLQLTYEESIHFRIPWKEKIPHVVIFQYPVDSFQKLKEKKKLSFTYDKYEYSLDSVAIIDNEKNHFIGLLTCNGEEYSYDGASLTRLVPMKWKHLLNEDKDFSVHDTYDFKGNLLYWNFTKGYQMLVYYRKK